MTPRERFLAALNHEEPDRVPLDLGGINTSLMVGTHDNLKNHLGLKEDPTQILSKIWQIAKTAEPILERLSIDSRYVFPEMKMLQVGRNESDDQFIDEWGVKRRFVMHYYEMEEHPLGGAIDIEDIESYPWPEPSDHLILDGLRERAKCLREETDYAVCGYPGGASLFEQAWYLRGYTDLLVDFMVNKDLAHAILSHILDVRKKNAELFLNEAGEYLDVFLIGDDIATQDNPAMSPDLYREMVKPYQAELFAFVKERTPAKLYYHSCGSVVPLIDDLIEIGVDALNPIQVTARGMDTAELKRRFGGRIAFWGAIDSQKALPFGTPDDVRREVQQRISDLAPGGGYILAGVHNLQPDISPENIIAMYEEGAEFGRYPIN
jgi:uroporphyrinogen decarboxylase